MNITVRPESPADKDAIRLVNQLAFGQEGEARLVDSLRAGGFVRVSLVAEQAGQVIGHILFSDLPIITESGRLLALALAPMAVLPEFQRQGVGSAMIRQGMDECRRQGHKIIVVLGHPNFYQRFGFNAELARQLESPYAGEAFMAIELAPGSLAGVRGQVHYPPPFEGV